MKNLIIRTISILLLSLSTAHASDPLPSWRNGPAKQSIISFINKTTQTGSPDFVPIEERIAVFDNDGTLWSEQPNYVQLVFAIDRVKELAPKHPEWRITQPFQAALEGDLLALRQQGEGGLLKLITATHAGMSTTDYSKIVSDWLSTQRWCISLCLKYLAILKSMDLKTILFQGAALNLCAHGLNAYMVSRPNR